VISTTRAEGGDPFSLIRHRPNSNRGRRRAPIARPAPRRNETICPTRYRLLRRRNRPDENVPRSERRVVRFRGRVRAGDRPHGRGTNRLALRGRRTDDAPPTATRSRRPANPNSSTGIVPLRPDRPTVRLCPPSRRRGRETTRRDRDETDARFRRVRRPSLSSLSMLSHVGRAADPNRHAVVSTVAFA
jgi:hypothetical protein